MTRYHNPSRALQTKTARSIETVRQPVPEGKVRCGACEGITTLTRATKRLRKHKTPRGEDCPNIISGERFEIAEIPPVVFDARSGSKVGNGCRECGKWLPGERSLCGACYVKNGGR